MGVAGLLASFRSNNLKIIKQLSKLTLKDGFDSS